MRMVSHQCGCVRACGEFHHRRRPSSSIGSRTVSRPCGFARVSAGNSLSQTSSRTPGRGRAFRMRWHCVNACDLTEICHQEILRCKHYKPLTCRDATSYAASSGPCCGNSCRTSSTSGTSLLNDPMRASSVPCDPGTLSRRGCTNWMSFQPSADLSNAAGSWSLHRMTRRTAHT